MPTFPLTLILCSSVGLSNGLPGYSGGGVFSQTATQSKEQGQVSGKADLPYPLSEAQMQAIKAIANKHKKLAAPVALRVAQTAQQVYGNLLAETPDEQLADKLRQQLKDVVGELLVMRGEAMREAVKVLTTDQKRFLKNELAKPGNQGELIEVMMKVFKIPEK